MKNTKTALVTACFFIAAISNTAYAQIEDALLNLMMATKPRLIALLSEEKATLWDSLRRDLGNRETLRTVARQHDLRVVLPSEENRETTIVIDNKLLASSSQYEIDIIQLSIESMLSHKYFTLNELNEDQRESLLEWLERYAPMRFLNIRMFDSRFHDVLVFPTGLIRAAIQVEDGRLLSGYVEEIYPSEKTDLQFAKELYQKSPMDYKVSDIERYREQLMKQVKQRLESESLKMNIFSIGVSQEELNEIVATALTKYTAEAVEQAQQQRKSMFEQLQNMLRDICSNRLGSDLRNVSSLEELPESLQSSIMEMLRWENLKKESIRGLHIEIHPGLVIGIINKHKKYYGVYKMDLAGRGSAGIGGYPLDANSE